MTCMIGQKSEFAFRTLLVLAQTQAALVLLGKVLMASKYSQDSYDMYANVVGRCAFFVQICH